MTLDLLHAPDLSVFAPPLQRLILCGGGGLPAAYGPLCRQQWNSLDKRVDVRYLWDPHTQRAGGNLVMGSQDRWSLPLDHWRDRLALVAAWMLEHWCSPDAEEDEPDPIPSHAARVRIDGGGYVLLELWLVRPDEEGESLTAWGWHKTNGMGASGLRLATLPARLTASDPSAALPLALMDVPEIRARVEAL